MLQRAFAFGFLSVLLFSCSSTSVYVPILRPAEIHIDRLSTIAVGHFRCLPDWGEGHARHKAVSDNLERLLSSALVQDQRLNVIDPSRFGPMLGENGVDIDEAPNMTTGAKIHQMIGVNGWIAGQIIHLKYNETVTAAKLEGRDAASTKNVRIGILRLRVLIQVIDLQKLETLWSDTLEVTSTRESKAVDHPPPDLDEKELEASACTKLLDDFLCRLTPRREQAVVTFLRDGMYPEMDKGIKAAEKGNWTEAILIFKKVLEKGRGQEREDRLWYNLGVCQQYTHNFKAAKESFEQSLRIKDSYRYKEAIDKLLEMEREFLELVRQKQRP